MKCLIIGGNRYFGLKLARSLIEKGHEVSVLNRGSREDGLGNTVRRFKADRTDRRVLGNAVAGHAWDVIYDNACFDGSQALDACEIFAGKTRRYIFTSSLSVYPFSPNLKEDDYDSRRTKKDSFPKNPSYAIGKRNAETAFFSQNEFPVVAVRFPIVLGPDDYTGRLEFHVQRVQQQKPIYFRNLEASISLIHSKDAAGFLEFVAPLDFSGPINVASADPVVLSNLMKWIEKCTGRTALISQNEGHGEESPFGVPNDWTMDVSRMLSTGYRAQNTEEWLPPLIDRLARSPTPVV